MHLALLSLAWLFLAGVGFFALAYMNASGRSWTVASIGLLALGWTAHMLPTLALLFLSAAFVLLALPLNIDSLRRRLFSDGVLSAFRKVLPPMSQTEREAIEAGTVWWDGDLFSGKPDWNKLLAVRRPALTDEEQRFLDNDVEMLCDMVTDWETTHVHQDLPPEVWQFIKDRGFLGMIIPKAYGG